MYIQKKYQSKSLVKKLRLNILYNYIFTFIKSFDVTQSVWMLYLASKGLPLFEIGLMEGIFHVTSFTMEMPTGVIADLFGRKTSRCLGRVFSIVSALFILSSHTFLGIAFSFILSALAYNLESGAGEALLYDSLKELKEEGSFMKINGKIEWILQWSGAIALIVGGYLATQNYTYVYILDIGLAILALIEGFLFTEPMHSPDKTKIKLKSAFINQFKTSFSVLKEMPMLFFFMVLSESVSVFVTTSFYYIQTMLSQEGLDNSQIGGLLAISSLLCGLAATQASSIEKRFGLKPTLYILLSGIPICLLLIGINLWVPLALIMMSIFEVIEFVVMHDYMNRYMPSQQRATLLSATSMLFSLFMILLFPLMGLIGDIFGLYVAFLAMFALSLIVSILLIRKIIKGL